MHDRRRTVEDRIHRTLVERLRPAEHRRRTPCRVSAWQVPGEPVPFAEAVRAPYAHVDLGAHWGPPWTTTWFRLDVTVPDDVAGEDTEIVFDPGFTDAQPGFQCEGLAHLPDGTILTGLHPRRRQIPLHTTPGQHLRVYVETAANPTVLRSDGFLPTLDGDPHTAGHAPRYRLRRADLAVFDATAHRLNHDIDVLDQLMHELPVDSPRRGQIRHALEAALDRLDLHDIHGTAADARAELADVLAAPAQHSAHRLHAVGHAHIDSAWLWPVRETRRKVTRTLAGVAALAETHPQLRFAMSQPQQLEWLREDQPRLFERIRALAAEGVFVPMGGMWVEPDAMLAGGEAMARQLVHGKRFHLEHFGVETEEVWLPDSFGCSAGLPQLIAQARSRWFLTQKLSWNRTNRLPHHTFWWEGIDGTRIFTHCPPADTYNAEITGRELGHAQRTFAEHGRATRSLLPYGHGDGGGGPTRDMLARAARTADLEGSPRVEHSTPAEFFAAAHAEYPDAPVWAGELYLEAHRGAATTQLKTKQGNRRCEHLLREAELWCATAAARDLLDYPYGTLDRLWKSVLLHQFHDILPGTSIVWVHRDAEITYAHLTAELDALVEHALAALTGGPGPLRLVFNAAPHDRAGIPALGAAPIRVSRPDAVRREGHDLVLDNGLVRATVDRHGLLSSVRDLVADRETLAPGASGNLLQLHPDHPNAWDAWDLDDFYRNTGRDLDGTGGDEHCTVDADGDTVHIVRTLPRLRLTQRLRLAPDTPRLDVDTTIDWQEDEKILKAAFPLDVHTDRSASETHFGHVHRPAHTNTSWDAAKFESAAHRWIHVGEPGYGIALINDSTHGHDVTRHPRAGGGTTTTVRLSLLRAPRFPDPTADRGEHSLRYSLLVGADIGDAVREGYRLNLPLRVHDGQTRVEPIVHVDNPAVIVEAVKLADDRSGDLVVRLYESRGGRARATLTTTLDASTVTRTDLLERTWDGERPQTFDPDTGFSVDLRPFEIRTVRLATT
ncbi:alpha-mannosidase [Allosaccharopolyspora coralli]|uniref:Alpha-mannosidase n=1 Tax=Allosaccharopolyspora coralli TaxID=2665642 RepID=A0A5Q3Q9P3_9PSEU|nr:glycoside hydrolase family 38 C-terminal domain-containing protein [Allosaccharopolyspora coralli]QGK69924.1 alpha-mannosidase [Allosaccharopolyspora coralli]